MYIRAYIYTRYVDRVDKLRESWERHPPISPLATRLALSIEKPDLLSSPQYRNDKTSLLLNFSFISDITFTRCSVNYCYLGLVLFLSRFSHFYNSPKMRNFMCIFLLIVVFCLQRYFVVICANVSIVSVISILML